MIKKAERNKEKKNKKIKQGFTKHDESRTTNIALRTVNKAKVLCVCVFVLFLFFFSFATPLTHKKKKMGFDTRRVGLNAGASEVLSLFFF